MPSKTLHPTSIAERWMSPAELQRRALAAASLAMRGSMYAPEDRAECAAVISETLLSKAQRRDRYSAPDLSGPLGAPCADSAERGAMLRRLDNWHRQGSMLDFLRTAPTGEILRSDATFTRMSGIAANYRRSIDRTRIREEQEAGERAATEGFRVPSFADTLSELAELHPVAAHRAAREALSALGLPRLGKAYPLAYAAVRGIAERSACHELGIGADSRTDGAARVAVSKALSKARAAVPSYSPDAPEGTGRPSDVLRWISNAERGAERFTFNGHLSALMLLDSEGRSVKASYSRTHSADLDTRDRTSQDSALRSGIISPEVSASKTRKMSAAQVGASLRRAGTRERLTTVGPHASQHWREGLTDVQRARLMRASELRRLRADSPDAAERDRSAAPAGLPYVVR